MPPPPERPSDSTIELIAEEVAGRLAESLRAGREQLAHELEEWKERQLAGIRAGDNVNALRFARLEELIAEGHTRAETWRNTTGTKVDTIREDQLRGTAQCDKHEEIICGKQGKPGMQETVETHKDRFRYVLVFCAIMGPLAGAFTFLYGNEIKERGILNHTEKELAAIIDARIWRAKRIFSNPTNPKSTSENPPIDPDS